MNIEYWKDKANYLADLVTRLERQTEQQEQLEDQLAAERDRTIKRIAFGVSKHGVLPLLDNKRFGPRERRIESALRWLAEEGK